MNKIPAKKPAEKKGIQKGQGKKECAPFKKGEVFSLEEDLTRKGPSLRFRYWRGWVIHSPNLNTAAIFPSADAEHVNRLKEKFLSDSNSTALNELLEKAPGSLRDSHVIEKIYELQFKNSIELKKIGSGRGTTPLVKLRWVIKKDIESFKDMAYELLEGMRVQGFTEDHNDALIWRNYIKPARVILRALESDERSREGWEVVFRCFEVMAGVVGHNTWLCSINSILRKEGTILLIKVDALNKNGLEIYRP